MRSNKLVKIKKVNKSSEPAEEIEVSQNFIFNPNRKRIGYYISEVFMVLDRESKLKYESALQSIYESKNGKYIIETNIYRLTVEISNME